VSFEVSIRRFFFVLQPCEDNGRLLVVNTTLAINTCNPSALYIWIMNVVRWLAGFFFFNLLSIGLHKLPS
jgi:hypothetical protein